MNPELQDCTGGTLNTIELTRMNYKFEKGTEKKMAEKLNDFEDLK